MTTPPDWTCDAQKLTREMFKETATGAIGTVTCSSSGKGSYEARGELRIGYDMAVESRIATESMTWKFNIKP